MIEGEEQILDAKFSVISKHPLHHKISLVYKQPIEERSFAKWSMGFNKIGIENLDGVQSLNDIYNDEAFNKHPKDVLELLKMFKDETLF